MAYVFSQLWPWFLPIFLVGLATAAWARPQSLRERTAPWLIWFGLAYLLGVLLAIVHGLEGRADFWLETALAGFFFYILGAAAGSLFRKNALREHDKWALGLVPAALIWLAANLMAMPGFETDLAKEVQNKVEASGAAAKFAVEGRDVLLDGNAPDRETEAKIIDRVDGVRQVVWTKRFAPESDAASTAVEPARKEGKAAEDAQKAEAQKSSLEDLGRVAEDAKTAALKAAEEAKAAAEKARASADKALGAAADAAKAAARNPAKEAEPAPHAGAKERTRNAEADLTALPRAGEFDAAACQRALSATLIVDNIQFRTASAKIRRASASVLDRLAAFLQRCDSTRIEIGGHTDDVGDDESNQALSQRRADAVMKYLASEGVAASRMTAVGYGAKNPIASNDDEEGRALNRRIEMIVR
ncbi:MAG TPA: OmpA family protein [Methylocystis sp.]|nr:OmpA family protein [Methylocystis sp.]